MTEYRRGRSSGHSSRSRVPAEPMYGEVVRLPEGQQFAFARANGREVFFHASNGRKIDGVRDGRPWLIESEDLTRPKMGDQIFMLVIPGQDDRRTGAPGWKAMLWAQDPKPLAFNYEGDIKGWQEFTKASRRREFTLNDYDREQAAAAAQRYLDLRILELTSSSQPRQRCWYQAINEVQYVATTVNRLELDVDTSARLEELKRSQKPNNPRDPVERVVKRMLAELNAGRPCSADRVLDEARTRERGDLQNAVRRERSRQRRDPWSISRSYSAGVSDAPTWREEREHERDQAPVTLAFREDPALVLIQSSCFSGSCNMKSALQDAVRTAYFEGRTSEIAEIWNRAHKADPSFEADSYFGRLDFSGIYEWCKVGAFGLVDSLQPLIEGDKRYMQSSDMIRRYLPSKAERPSDRFAPITKMMRDRLSRGFSKDALELYDKYVAKLGREQAFLEGDASRARLLEDMRAMKPLEDIRSLLYAIANYDQPEAESSLGEALVLYNQATEAMRAHSSWWRVECDLVWADITCQRYQAALDRLLPLLIEHAEPEEGETWEHTVKRLYEGWIDQLCREKRYDEVATTLAGAPELFRDYDNWSEIMQLGINQLLEADQIQSAWDLLLTACEIDPDHDWNRLITGTLVQIIESGHDRPGLFQKEIAAALLRAQELRPELGEGNHSRIHSLWQTAIRKCLDSAHSREHAIDLISAAETAFPTHNWDWAVELWEEVMED